MSEHSWRLIHDGVASGARNMAVDEAMLLAHARHAAPPTLRFYGWEPFCLSLGRLQKHLPPAAQRRLENGVNLDDANFDIVRRPTGGRSVWHSHEITYSVAVREDLLSPENRSVEGAYRWVSEGFLVGLQSLGLPVEMAPGGVRTNGSNCFAASASCDFVANGKKLIGAAQCRKDGAILQHGSLLLSIREEEWQKYAGGPMDSATSLEMLGLKVSNKQIIDSLGQGFASVSGANWNRLSLSEREEQLAQTLYLCKYTRDEWNYYGQQTPECLARIEKETQFGNLQTQS